METHQVDVLASAMLGDFEKIDDALEPGRASKLRSDVPKADREDGIDLDVASSIR